MDGGSFVGDPDRIMSPARKKVKSRPPDVIVSVGSGDNKQEFECYGVTLSFASEYLDAMLGSSMREGTMNIIEFPEKDPEEWKSLYEFISPETNRTAKITNKNVLVLIPWFHEFQMAGYVNECDKYLANAYFSDIDDEPVSFWIKPSPHDKEKRKGTFDSILDVLQLSHMYNMNLAKDEMEEMISVLLSLSPHTQDLFDLSVAKILLSLVLPIELNDETGLKMTQGESKHLWPIFKKILSPHISNLSQEIINGDNFPHLFYAYMQIKVEKDRARGIVNTMIHQVPSQFPSYPTDYRVRYSKFCRATTTIDTRRTSKNLKYPVLLTLTGSEWR